MPMMRREVHEKDSASFLGSLARLLLSMKHVVICSDSRAQVWKIGERHMGVPCSGLQFLVRFDEYACLFSRIRAKGFSAEVVFEKAVVIVDAWLDVVMAREGCRGFK